MLYAYVYRRYVLCVHVYIWMHADIPTYLLVLSPVNEKAIRFILYNQQTDPGIDQLGINFLMRHFYHTKIFSHTARQRRR
jgi:hypothetical protein